MNASAGRVNARIDLGASAHATRMERTMRSRMRSGSAVVFLALLAGPAVTMAQATDEGTATIDPQERVLKYDLGGPRLGATFAPDGSAITQFGWHFESQVGPGKRGPWFIVERVFLIGGLERNAFIPNGTLIFGMRLPNSFEFGVGPSVTIGGMRGFNSGLVAAVGHSFRMGGIRIPVNVAYAAQKDGEQRWTLITGWAVRDQVGIQPEHYPSPNTRLEEGGS